ncbi:hypothetical protein C8Q72DRAFT_135905 [Fomitopsis betulina]|nr:hypothetical protein C8Q72DRAFT_135905 [Fomitopsis betulina]
MAAQQSQHYQPSRIRATNALAPISTLPPEILSNIFLRIAGRGSADPARWEPRMVGRWIHVTHVCTSWREVALQCTPLWSHLHVPDSPKILEELLVRSRSAPLSITLQLRAMDTVDVEASASTLLGLCALHRVRALLVAVDEEYVPTSEVLEWLGGRAPMLDSLKITGVLNSSKSSALRSAISRMLTHPETRALRSLSTKLCCPDWRGTTFHGLTRLDVYGDYGPSGIGATSLLKGLACMPCLEELRLFRVFNNDVDHGNLDLETLRSPIILPRLRQLAIRDECQPLTGKLLSNLRTPCLRHLDLHVFERGLENDSALPAATLQKATTLGPLSTLFYVGPGSFCAYRGVCRRTTDPKDDSTSEWLEQHTPALRLHGRLHQQNPLTALIASLPCRDTRTCILYYGFPSQDEWLSLTRGMESVTELRLHHGAYDANEMGTMLSLRHEDLGDGHAPFVLPNLDAVTLDGLDCHEDGQLGDDLATCFAQRAREGAEIKTVRVLNMRFLCEDFERLRDLVPCVETDGQPEDRDTVV